MILLVSGATSTLRRLPLDAPVGHLVTPHTGNRIADIAASGRPWAADNGCGPKADGTPGELDEGAFWAMCEEIAQHCDPWRQPRTRRPLWVVCPDVVGDATGTWARWQEWAPRLLALRLPLAYVIQDGYRSDQRPPLAQVRCAFLGGSTAFKESDEARQILRHWLADGKAVHVGRVNTERRLRLFDSLGTDHNGYPIQPSSIDGTQFSRYPDTYIPRWAERLQPSLRGRLAAPAPLPLFGEDQAA
jgi:hypothetical protein